jgi:hypothetical protein
VKEAQEIEKLKYPIGKFRMPKDLSPEFLASCIRVINEFPSKLKLETEELTEDQLDTPYRPGGWTIRQVVHHCADSHMNSLIRFKLALTEDTPTIKPYDENLWAELADCKNYPILSSLLILEGVHARWGGLFDSFLELDLNRTFIHPEQGKEMSLAQTMALYAWHCAHHLAHITELKKKMGWS